MLVLVDSLGVRDLMYLPQFPYAYSPQPEFMEEAIVLASRNLGYSDQAVGAVMVCPMYDGSEVIVGRGRNMVHQLHDPRAHAENQAFGEALTHKLVFLRRDVLPWCVMYTTPEPCLMCAGVIWSANLRAVVYGASRKDAIKYAEGRPWFAWRSSSLGVNRLLAGSGVQITGGYMRERCLALMRTSGVRDGFMALALPHWLRSR